jgi:hypothetical protein
MAMTYPKRVIAAGPGNPPVLIDETADVPLAAAEITRSASYDNNVLCIAEKEIFVVEKVFEEFMREMEKAGNVRLTTRQMDDLAKKALTLSGKHWLIVREFAGKSATVLGKAIGLTVAETVPMLFGGVGADDLLHPGGARERLRRRDRGLHQGRAPVQAHRKRVHEGYGACDPVHPDPGLHDPLHQRRHPPGRWRRHRGRYLLPYGLHAHR